MYDEKYFEKYQNFEGDFCPAFWYGTGKNLLLKWTWICPAPLQN
jgi:hypothetical protein